MRKLKYQGQLVQDMTEQVQKSETKLHSYKVQELYDKRKRELEAKIKEEEVSKEITSKDQLLNQLSLELFETRDRLGNIKKDLDGPSLIQNRSMLALGPNALNISRTNAHMNASLPILSPQKSMSPNKSRIQEEESPKLNMQGVVGSDEVTSVSRILATLGTGHPAADILSKKSELVGQSSSSKANPADANEPQSGASNANPAHGDSWAFMNDSLHTDEGASKSVHQAYQPYPGDELDGALAEYLNDNPNHIPLFCRLSNGMYLYGTNKVKLRLNEGIIEADTGNDNWELVEDFLKAKMESAQALY